MDRIPVTKQAIATLTQAARLDLPEDRTQLMAETMDEIFELLDTLDGVELGETPPAFAYRAKWEGR